MEAVKVNNNSHDFCSGKKRNVSGDRQGAPREILFVFFKMVCIIVYLYDEGNHPKGREKRSDSEGRGNGGKG